MKFWTELALALVGVAACWLGVAFVVLDAFGPGRVSWAGVVVVGVGIASLLASCELEERARRAAQARR